MDCFALVSLRARLCEEHLEFDEAICIQTGDVGKSFMGIDCFVLVPRLCNEV